MTERLPPDEKGEDLVAGVVVYPYSPIQHRRDFLPVLRLEVLEDQWKVAKYNLAAASLFLRRQPLFDSCDRRLPDNLFQNYRKE